MAVEWEQNLKNKMFAGADKLADAVKVTIGPLGRNVAVHQKANIRDADYGDQPVAGAHTLITNDGVTIAKSIVLPDPVENMGAQILKEAAIKANDAVGDGTTTAIVLAQAMMHGERRNISAGANPIILRRGMEKAVETCVKELRKHARKIETEEDLCDIAEISCQDPEMGEQIGKAFHRIGLEGVMHVEESEKRETSLEIQEGIVFDRGYAAPYMVTDQEKLIAELKDPYILFADRKFTNPQDLIPALMIAAENGRPILIIADGFEGEALGLVQMNKKEGDMDIVCVNAPLYGEGRRWRMEDMALQTGGTYITEELGMNIRNITEEMLGTASSARVTMNQTMILGGKGDPDKIQDRIRELRYYTEHTDYEFNRERYQERLAAFVSGVAILRVGGETEPEIWERKMRAEDAVHAVRAAYEEGVVAGGGIALLDTLPELRVLAEELEDDERTGVEILMEAIQSPIRNILHNAGVHEEKILGELLEAEPDTGYDLEKEAYCNMFEAGIVDPLKVTRLALACAASVAATLLTTEAGVTRIQRADQKGEQA